MESFDVIIVGAGAGGLSAGWQISKSGLKVACFEMGDKINKEDIIPIKQGGEIQKFDFLNSNPNIRKLKNDYQIDSNASPINIANFNGVGGSTTLFSAQYPRMNDTDFNVRTLDKVANDWPISLNDLEKYYSLNDKITGLAGLKGDPFYPNVYPNMPPVPLGPMGRKIAKAFDDLNWHWWPAYSAINTSKFNGRVSDNYKRPSNLGDFTGSKGSVENTYLPLALKNGLILKTNTTVLKLNVDVKTGFIESINYKDSNNKFSRAYAKIFIIAASGIGTPRLLLSSKSESLPNGIANSSDMVGRNLMLHPLGYVEGIFDENIFSNIGPQGCCLLSQEFLKTNLERDFIRGYTFQVIRGPLPIESGLNLTARKIIKFGNNFYEGFKNYYNHTAHITVITEDLPDKNNRVKLDLKDKKDFKNNVKIQYQLSQNTKNMLIHGLNKGRIIMKKANAIKSYAYGPVRDTGWHTLGTCRMGKNKNNSVVNKYGKTHDFENLFITDGSIFVTSGGVNPASTIQALSLYISEMILKRYKKLLAN